MDALGKGCVLGVGGIMIGSIDTLGRCGQSGHHGWGSIRSYSCLESFKRGLGTWWGAEVSRSCTRSFRSRASQCAASRAVCYVPVRQTATRLSHRFAETCSRYQIKSPETGNDLSEPYEPPSCDSKEPSLKLSAVRVSIPDDRLVMLQRKSF